MPHLSQARKATSLFILSIALIAVIMLASFLQFRRFRQSVRDVVHAQNILRVLGSMYSGIQDAETGQRGYLLTGDSNYLVPYQQGRIGAQHAWDEVKRLTANDATEQRTLDAVKIRMNQKFDELQLTINLIRGRHVAQVEKIVLSNVGEILMNELREEIFGLQQQEREALRSHQENLDEQTHERMWILFIGAAVSIALLSWMFYLLEHENSERRKSQAALQFSQAQLTLQTIELTAANKELEAFCYSVSHDLRAPLRGIAGFSQLVRDKYETILDREGVSYLDRVKNGIQRMGHLIDDLLNLSRITRAELIFEAIDLAPTAKEVVQNIQAYDHSARQVEWVIADHLPARADARLMRTALENLLGNAWKFSAKRDFARIELGVDKNENETVYFVRDNGAGFDMTYADKLFTAFQRLHTTAEFSGTGIGLATVHRIIQRHGGRMWAEGQVDRGATFYFTLGGHYAV